MAFYYLNKVPKDLDKKALETLCKQYGKLKFVGDIRDDFRNHGFCSTIAVFHTLENTDLFEEACKQKGIRPVLKKDTQNNSSNNNIKHKNTHHHKTGKPQNTQHDKRPKATIANPSFYFYKDDAYGRDIADFVLKQNHAKLFSIEGTEGFSLTTIYPGLLVGGGYTHPKLKSNDDDFQLGFFFDHTTGLPLISGSSIKGVLRSVLENEELAGTLYEAQLATLSLTPKQVVEILFEEDGAVFYDAYIEKTDNEGKKIFGEDYITSHHSDDEGGALKEPNPVRFLKVLPEVTFRFQFSFKKRENVQVRLELFEAILLDFGVGAKTNVGYGQFRKA